jgi:hypothetical protein
MTVAVLLASPRWFQAVCKRTCSSWAASIVLLAKTSLQSIATFFFLLLRHVDTGDCVLEELSKLSVAPPADNRSTTIARLSITDKSSSSSMHCQYCGHGRRGQDTIKPGTCTGSSEPTCSGHTMNRAYLFRSPHTAPAGSCYAAPDVSLPTVYAR